MYSLYKHYNAVERSWKRIKYLYLMSHISGSSCLFYTMCISPPSLKSAVKAKTDDNIWGKTPRGSIKLSIQLLTGLACPLRSTEPERAVLPQAAQGCPKGRHGLANKAQQARRVTFSCFVLHIAVREPLRDRTWNVFSVWKVLCCQGSGYIQETEEESTWILWN